MLRRVTLMLTLAAIAVLVVAPAAQSKTMFCKSGHVCKGTSANDLIFGSIGNDNIRPFGGNDYVFGNSGDDVVAHSYGDDRIFGGCGSDTVRGGFGFDRIYANMPDTWFDMSFVCSRDGNVSCAPVTTSESSGLPLTLIQITTLAEAAGNDVDDSPSAHDLVDCAWLGSRGDEGLEDVGFGQPANAVAPAVADTVVDCSNRDDQAPR
jgi:Ca2+-binding RTX toxin-like protein